MFCFKFFSSIRKSWWNIILLWKCLSKKSLGARSSIPRCNASMDMYLGYVGLVLPQVETTRVLPWIHGFSGKWAPKKWKEPIILEIHPFSFHGFHERFPWIHGRKVVVISYGKVSRTVLTEVYYVYSSFTLKADGTQSDDPASETGSHLMDSGGRSWTKLPGSRVFPLLI